MDAFVRLDPRPSVDRGGHQGRGEDACSDRADRLPRLQSVLRPDPPIAAAVHELGLTILGRNTRPARSMNQARRHPSGWPPPPTPSTLDALRGKGSARRHRGPIIRSGTTIRTCRGTSSSVPDRARLRPQPYPPPDAILAAMTAPTLDAEPACPGPVLGLPPQTTRRSGACVPSAGRSTRSLAKHGTALAAQNPWSTPFSAWAFHRAWWDAYGANAHDETLVVVRRGPRRRTDGDRPSDASTRGRTDGRCDAHDASAMPTDVGSDGRCPEREGDPVRRSYHSDYATVLGDPGRSSRGRAGRRRLRRAPVGDDGMSSTCDAFGCQDPTGNAARRARSASERPRPSLTVEREDVCPVVTFPRASTSRATSRRSGRRNATRSGARSAEPRRSARSV